ncbi:MAG TPA: protein-glutamate O-methyltransferase CheR [Candidatus Krumholzibacteria bacterium]|nr:protein-glutamate O-methyltransferase CheR [Candidatus Krumholzibacteria bacterium]
MATPTIDKDTYDALRHCLEREAGIALGEDKQYLIEGRLHAIMAAEGCTSWSEFLGRARADASGRIREAIIDAMTTNETLWFRDEDPFTVLREVLIPRWADEIRQGTRQRVRIWCTACSTGQEPYSVMITLLEAMRTQPALRPEHIEILATDISETALAAAREGRFNSVAMARGMRPELRSRYFREDGRVAVIRPEAAGRITFRRFNLQASFSLLGSFDAVLNRYVAIYFAADFKRELYRKIRGVLRPGGALFLGSSESLTGYEAGFTARRQGKAIYFESDGAAGDVPPAEAVRPTLPAAAAPAPAPAADAPVDSDIKAILASLRAINARQP